jgi:hypothetical protein
MRAMRALVAWIFLLSDISTGMSRRLRYHHFGLITVVHRLDAWSSERGMRHRAWHSDRGGDALKGQRHDQYP